MAKKKKSPDVLDVYDGKDVVEMSIALRSAGDGLSKALEIEPQEFHIGDTVDILARCRVSDITHREVKDTDCLERIIVFRPGTVTIVDQSISDEMIKLQEDKLDEAKGISKIPFVDDQTGDTGDEPGLSVVK